MTTRWSVEIPAPPVQGAAPLADERHAFLALRNGQIVARALADGSESWRRDLATERPLALDGGLLFVTAPDAVHALKAVDGTLAWELPRSQIVAPVVARSGWVVIVSGDSVAAVRGADGTVVWEHAVGRIAAAPVINGERLYLSAQDGRVMAMTLATGAQVWQQQLPGPAGEPYSAGDRVYVAAADKHFYCLKDNGGGIDWDYRIGATVETRAVADDQHVYFIAMDNVLRAHDRVSGALKWQHGLRRRPGAGPDAIHGFVLVPSASSAEIWAWDADGKGTTAIATGDSPAGAPAVLDLGIAGTRFLVVTGTLASVWQLKMIGTAGDPPLSPLKALPGRALSPEAR